jgi:primosomal replication protein N
LNAGSAARLLRRRRKRLRLRPRQRHLETNRDARAAGGNRLVLDVTIAVRDDLRYTPAGIPALSLTLNHASVQPEAGGQRKVELELAGVAFGPTAEALARLPEGAALRCEGFLARRYRTGTTLALHIERFEADTNRAQTATKLRPN